MTHEDIFRQIPDYVLGLVSPTQKSIVERHAAHCTDCQHAIRRERKLGQLVRLTLDAATKPDAANIRCLMPAIPQQRRSGLILTGWQKQLAPALLILLLLFSGFILNQLFPARSGPSLIATAHAATATSTNTPTATLIHSVPEKYRSNHLSISNPSSVLNLADPFPSPFADRPIETPDPHPTPAVSIK